MGNHFGKVCNTDESCVDTSKVVLHTFGIYWSNSYETHGDP